MPLPLSPQTMQPAATPRVYAPGAFGPTERPSRDRRWDPIIRRVPATPPARIPTRRWSAVRAVTRAATRWPYAYALPYHWQVERTPAAPASTPGTSLHGGTPAAQYTWPALATTASPGRLVAPRAN